MGAESEEAERFIPLSEFRAPPMPPQEVLRGYFGRLLAQIGGENNKPFIADDKLKKATLDRLDDVVAPPACGPLIAELGNTIKQWGEQSPAVSHMHVVVLPPCDSNEIIETWGRQAGHQILEAPPRAKLALKTMAEIPTLDGKGILVVPRLEEWFLRHRNGLATVRKLIAALDAADRPVVVGCNSWAWAFLGKAIRSDLLLPDPVTFQPFDQVRLHGWFLKMAGSDDTKDVRFRLPSTGEDVLAVDDNGKLKTGYLQALAGRSLGIPWVAWHLWRRSLQSRVDDSVAGDAKAVVSDNDPSEQTLWIAALDEYLLPKSDEQSAMLVLHALLIHGSLTTDEMRLVLPIVGESNIVAVLAKAGFVERRGSSFACRAAAYPVIRAGLAKAGFSMDGF